MFHSRIPSKKGGPSILIHRVLRAFSSIDDFGGFLLVLGFVRGIARFIQSIDETMSYILSRGTKGRPPPPMPSRRPTSSFGARSRIQQPSRGTVGVAGGQVQIQKPKEQQQQQQNQNQVMDERVKQTMSHEQGTYGRIRRQRSVAVVVLVMIRTTRPMTTSCFSHG
jgi:hypothetical protein